MCFYYADPRGKHKSIYGSPVSRFSSRNNKEFRKELRLQSGKQIFESDINPVFRCFEENYKDDVAPKLQTAFFDIEVDVDPVRGYSPTNDPFNAITAISVYLQWMEQLVTLVIPPKNMSWETAQEICDQFENTMLFEREEEMLGVFLDLIEDADVLSGWNSEGYDIPYTVNRVARVLSKDDTRRFCLWSQLPKKRTFERFGAENITFDLIGRVHMDYMQLYRKYTYEERHSYSLDAIGEYELDERKTLLMKAHWISCTTNNFKTFIEYNRQDTLVAGQTGQETTFSWNWPMNWHMPTQCCWQTTMGAVAVTEQAIINEAHERGTGCAQSTRTTSQTRTQQAAGAYVAYPQAKDYTNGLVPLTSTVCILVQFVR